MGLMKLPGADPKLMKEWMQHFDPHMVRYERQTWAYVYSLQGKKPPKGETIRPDNEELTCEVLKLVELGSFSHEEAEEFLSAVRSLDSGKRFFKPPTMNVSELIERLGRIIGSNGADLPVVLHDADTGDLYKLGKHNFRIADDYLVIGISYHEDDTIDE